MNDIFSAAPELAIALELNEEVGAKQVTKTGSLCEPALYQPPRNREPEDCRIGKVKGHVHHCSSPDPLAAGLREQRAESPLRVRAIASWIDLPHSSPFDTRDDPAMEAKGGKSGEEGQVMQRVHRMHQNVSPFSCNADELGHGRDGVVDVLEDHVRHHERKRFVAIRKGFEMCVAQRNAVSPVSESQEILIAAEEAGSGRG